MEPSDKMWIERYRQGEVTALETLILKHRHALYGFIVNLTAGRDDPDDVFQETWLKAVKKLDTYRHDNFCGWLIQIARNTAIDRSRRRRPDVSLDAESGNGRPMAETLVHPGPTPADRAHSADLGAAIARAVQGLPEEQKEVFLMRVEADLPFREIAKIQKVSINTALARMQYALAKLRAALEKEHAWSRHGPDEAEVSP